MKKFLKEALAPACIICTLCALFLWVGFDTYHRDVINGDQLAYAGAIIGGGITLLGVILTINHANSIKEKDKEERDQERKEELSAQYKPILKITIPEDEKEKKIIFREDANCFLINFVLYVENIGRGECLNIKSSYSSATDDFRDLPNLSVCSTFKNLSILATESECLPVTEKRQIMINAVIDKRFEKHHVISFYLDLTFHDAFSDAKLYKHSSKIVLRNNKSFNQLEEGYTLVLTNHYK